METEAAQAADETALLQWRGEELSVPTILLEDVSHLQFCHY